MVDLEPQVSPQTGDDLHEALAALHDLRQFVLANATQWKPGANHHNPIWVRVAETLDRHGMNNPDGRDGHGYIQGNPDYYRG